jgi:hypothetical protein
MTLTNGKEVDLAIGGVGAAMLTATLKGLAVVELLMS